MDDLSSAVIVTPIQHCNAAHFGRKFLENVLLCVGITGIVVVDADSKFRDVFQKMCAALNIRWIPLARGNHKGLKVERFHRFLNKNVKAECRRRDTNKIFVEAALMAAYAWNSAPTDDSDITRSYVAFGVNFKFPMDVDLDQLPHLLEDNTAKAINRFISMITQLVKSAALSFNGSMTIVAQSTESESTQLANQFRSNEATASPFKHSIKATLLPIECRNWNGTQKDHLQSLKY